ncbi:MAG: hypothetical protein MUD01_02930 [Chloroflexaceae bacterium]|nr:hypothetical protein [Chloroflexaceae bacterium]
MNTSPKPDSPWAQLRVPLGWCCIALGLLGMALPMMPGVALLVLGVALVGQRHPLLRRARVWYRLLLRRWAALPTPVIGAAGRAALRADRALRQQLRSAHRFQREAPPPVNTPAHGPTPAAGDHR